MLGCNDEVWVTSALCDQDVQKALVLCYSLRRTYTTRRIAIVASPKISFNLRQALNHVFDLVFFLDEDYDPGYFGPEDFAKLYSLVALRTYEKCVFVSPSSLAVTNCDEIFAGKTNGILLLENFLDTSVILFKPSIKSFKSLCADLKFSTMNGTGLGAYLKLWTTNQFKETGCIDEKYSIKMKNGHSLLRCEEDVSIVNLEEVEIEKLESVGMLEKLVVAHWNKINKNDVLPLLEHYSETTLLTCDSALTSFIPPYDKEPIAIVGMSCRYPGSNSLDEFWNLIFQGEDGTSCVPDTRWLPEQCSKQRKDARKMNAGFLKVPVDEFDAKFFGVSPKEVLFMDPQHRILHELVWEGLEDACVDANTLYGTSGSVFVGSYVNDYHHILDHSGNSEFYRGYMGNSIGAAAARISFLLGMTGPSLATESGCSSSMVAVHLACRSLQLRETNFALACGVNLILHPFNKDEIPLVLSPDGRCKTFSEDANGFARAEGVGVLVLKRLSDALNNGDHIWGLIRGSAVSQEGVSKSMGTPTIYCESLAMNEALYDARVSPEQVSYVEAHGTGTVVGDPMEVAAIANVYNSPNRIKPLVIGSVKTNLGHTESCSGIAGIMKVIMSMRHDTIPPHRNFTKLNPSIDLNAVPAVIPMERMEWKKVEGKPRIAGVSSFGITGTDAHVIVEESPQIRDLKVLSLRSNEIDRPLHILKISAKSEDAMVILLEKYKDAISRSDESIADIACSANTGRTDFPIRTAIIASNREEMYKSIDQKNYITGEANTEKMGKICFLFTGQGSQYPGMAKQLYLTSPVFRMHFDFCDRILKDEYNISITEIIWSSGLKNSCNEISRTIYSQTSIFCVEYALLKLWESWGVKPDYALGHSLGEFAAAVCAGVLSVEDALKLVAERSRLIDQLPRGKMLVIKADKERVDKAMKKFAENDKKKMMDYAAINSTQQTVVAGDGDIVLDFARFCTESGVKCTILDATHAFHSKHMDPMLKEYKEVASTVVKQAGRNCEYISGMIGDVVHSAAISADYWVQHTREKVQFLKASKKAVELGCEIFIEIGPQPVLSALTMMNNEVNLLCLPSLKRNENEWSTMLTTLGKLYVKGVDIDWNGLDQFYSRKTVCLPHYPFTGKKFWPDLLLQMGNTIHPLLGSVISNASSVNLFQCGINLQSHEYVKDHAIGQTAIFPGAGYLEMCLVAGLAAVQGSSDSLGKPSRPMKVENLIITAPLALEESKTTQVQTVVEFNTLTDDAGVKIYHRTDTDSSSWLPHAHATFSPVTTVDEQSPQINLTQFHEMLSQPSSDEICEKMYDTFSSLGLKFGPYFKSLIKLWRNDNDPNLILTKVKVPFDAAQYSQHIVHPVIVDAMLQAILLLKMKNFSKMKLHLPIKIEKFVWLSNVPTEDEAASNLYIQASDTAHCVSDDVSAEMFSNCSAVLLDSSGNILATMAGVEFAVTTIKAVESVLEQQANPMPNLWEEVWRPQMGPLQYPFDLDLCKKVMANSNQSLVDSIVERFNNRPDVQESFCRLDKLVYYLMLTALYKSGWEPTVNSIFNEDDSFQHLKIDKQHRKQFTYFLRVFEEEKILAKVDEKLWKVIRLPPSFQDIETKLAESTYATDLPKKVKFSKLITKIGANLHTILKGRQSVLTILFPENNTQNTGEPCAADFYSEYTDLLKMKLLINDVCSWMQTYKEKASAAGQHRVVLRILEVGAGTGGYTAQYLDVLEKVEVEFEYTYTDISTAFFPAAEKKFEKHLQNMKFKKLNIEEDPIAQGFVPSYYDLVCAYDVVHATKSLKNTLANVRSLLKPNGLFDLCESTCPSRYVTFVFGLLEGYWHFEDFDIRPNHCIITRNAWTDLVERNGFSVIGTYPCANENQSYMQMRVEDKNPTSCNHGGLSTFTEKEKMKTWMIFHQDNNRTSQYLADKISALVVNREVVLVRRGDKFEVSTPHDITLRPDNEEDFVKLFEDISTRLDAFEGIIYCWSLDDNCTAQEDILRSYFFLTKSLCRLKQGSLSRLYCLVNCIVPLEHSNLSNYNFSTLWGYNKSLRNETFNLFCKCIDVGSQTDENDMMQIFYELWNTEKECQVAFQDKIRFVPKLMLHKPFLHDLELPSGTDRFQLILPEDKSFSGLKFGPLDPVVLAPGEVELQVKATALNFRDVLNVLKPSEKFKDLNSVGFDFAGVVCEAHPEVTKWRVGDEVFGVNFNGASLPSHVRCHEDYVFPVPVGMTLNETCTLPAVVTTSYHCLFDVAHVKSTDTVLIHTASGGVGLSAIEICKHVGATIIATAGSKRKQDYVRKLGIEHVFHSRNTEYCDKILEVTGGRGVDVVLNSLTSKDFKEATLKACAQGAHFIEMSKLSTWEPEEVKKLRPDIKYTIVDLSAKTFSECRDLMIKVNELVENKISNPIPYVQFGALNIREALQYLHKAKHIGKVLCVMPEVKQSSGKTEAHTPMFSSKGSYLITGGLGGIGFEVCKWMVIRGAKYIVLAGRNPPNQSMQRKIDKLNSENSAKVQAVQLNVSNFQQCKYLLEHQISQMCYPKLRGVMHVAGTLHDGLIVNQSWETLSSTLRAKVVGTLNLHELTKNNFNLEHFVLFSSVASLFGSPGQSNHSAGNNFEDTFAHYRHSIGLPATSVNWGQWGEVGVATELDLPGIKPFSTSQGIAGLEYALKSHQTQIAVVNIESFMVLSKHFPEMAVYLDDRLWKSVSHSNSSSGPMQFNSNDFWLQYDSAATVEEKMELVKDRLRCILRNILKLDATDVIEDKTDFQQIGVDSLMFVEIRNALQTLFGERATVSPGVLKDRDTVLLLTETLVKLIEGDVEIDNDELPSSEDVEALIKEDCVLPDDIRAKQNQVITSVENISCVLLTGSTGTLGPYILKELTLQSKITEIYCLIRPGRKTSSEQRLKQILTERSLLSSIDFSKIRFVDGNVALAQLGMKSEIWEELCNKVDAIFHCAATVQHLEHYRKRNSDKDMRAVNVEGTKHMLEFACTGRKLKQVYYSSSFVTISAVDDDGYYSEDWPQPDDFNGVTSLAYPITKFVGDVIMKQAILERGIPGKVFRFPLIVGDSKTGRFVLDGNHIMLRYFFILKNGIMSSHPFPVAALPADTCAWASVQLFLNPSAPNDMYNVINTEPEADQEFIRAASKLGYNVSTVEFSKFAEKIRESTTEDSPYALFKDFYQSEENFMSLCRDLPLVRHWSISVESKRSFMISRKIRKYLPEFYTDVSLAMDHIYRDMLFAKRNGWLEKYTL